MAVLRHEGREYADGLCFGRVTLDGTAQMERISGPGTLLYVVYASTQDEAMQAHYDRQGWGQYAPVPGITDVTYDLAALSQQLKDYPGDDELRRLNGL
jgi:hypothetical protein